MPYQLSGPRLLELYYDRVFHSSVNLEDAKAEEEWLARMGWTVADFELLLAADSFGDLDA